MTRPIAESSNLGCHLKSHEQPILLPSPRGVNPLIRLTFAGFLLSIPFETASFGSVTDSGGGRVASISKFLGLVFLASCFVQPGACFRKVPTALWCFGAYLLCYVVLGLVQPIENAQEFVARLITLCQMLVLCWVAANVLSDKQTVSWALRGLVAGTAILAILQLCGISRVPDAATLRSMTHEDLRVTAFHEDPNTLAAAFGISIIACLAMASWRNGLPTYWRFLLWMIVPVLAVVLTETGSRGGLLAVLAGILTLAAASGPRAGAIRRMAATFAALAVLVFIAYHTGTMSTRVERTLKEGHTSGRSDIFENAWSMFLERPVVGWGPTRNYRELGQRMNIESRDTHNLFLWVLTEVGIVGAVPYFLGLGLCLRSALRARHSYTGSAALAFLICVLVVNMSLTWHNRKLHWLILGFALSQSLAPMAQQWRESGNAAHEGSEGRADLGRRAI